MNDPVVSAEISHNSISAEKEAYYSSLDTDAAIIRKIALIIESFEKEIEAGVTGRFFEESKQLRLLIISVLTDALRNRTAIKIMEEVQRDWLFELEDMEIPQHNSKCVREIAQKLKDGEYDDD